jgi:AcrR family transcriptional regulator
VPTLSGRVPTLVDCREGSAQLPTGVAIRDVRHVLFDAAERILLRDGLNALTSRAVTEEAGCAKGVLHRHFADFDEFLAELVRDRTAGIVARTDGLVALAGTGTVADNVSGALIELFSSVAHRILALVTFRDELRARLRRDTPSGLPMVREIKQMIRSYLTAEQERGRVPVGADVDTLALILISGGHLAFSDPDAAQAEAEVRKVVLEVLSGKGY